MAAMKRTATQGRHRSSLALASIPLILAMLVSATLAGCGGPSADDLERVDYTPLPGGDWEVSTPEEQGLDPMLVAKLYHSAAELETLYGLLVIKNGVLIAEGIFQQRCA